MNVAQKLSPTCFLFFLDYEIVEKFRKYPGSQSAFKHKDIVYCSDNITDGALEYMMN